LSGVINRGFLQRIFISEIAGVYISCCKVVASSLFLWNELGCGTGDNVSCVYAGAWHINRDVPSIGSQVYTKICTPKLFVRVYLCQDQQEIMYSAASVKSVNLRHP